MENARLFKNTDMLTFRLNSQAVFRLRIGIFFLSPDRQKSGSDPKIRLHENNVEELKVQVNFFIISYLALLRVCPVIYIPLVC